MFVSFFPRPKLFFWSALVWTALSMALWYGYVNGLTESSTPGVVGVALFWSAPSLWFDLYFLIAVAIFAGFWMTFAPHPWANWSILGSALILFTSYFQVQVSVAINSWYGPFYDLVQAALSKSKPVTIEGVRNDRRVRLIVRDEGPGFDVSSLPDPTDPANLGKSSGRGLLLIRTFMDDVRFNAAGNEITLSKRRR